MRRATLGVVALLLASPLVRAYSVLTHEAIIDSAWDTNIKPLLLKRYPSATPDELKEAHAYAYGGCIVQDMGYYPFGSKFFSDLVHYVRSGDFVINMIREAQDLNEYAFALGALAHYAADAQGHSVAVNPTVSLEYPKLRRRYGKVVTYEDDPTAHLRVEFSFDVVQVSREDYAPESYHAFIGFKVAKPVLDRAFQDTYSLSLSDVFGNVDLALGTYRHTVSTIIPEMTHVAWHINKHKLVQAHPGLTRRRFEYNLSRAAYRKEWDGNYRGPGIGTRILAVVMRVIPKIGPLKALKFKQPTAHAETLFEESFNITLAEYRRLLSAGDPAKWKLADLNLDTGKPTAPTEYRLADDTYGKLAVKLADHNPAAIDPQLRQNILAFFSNLNLPFTGKEEKDDWQQTVSAVDKLKSAAGPT